MTLKFPILRQYRGAWPIHEVIKQYLGTQKINFEKDSEAESNQTGKPDRKMIENYLAGLPSQRRMQNGNDIREEEEEEEEEGEGEEVGVQRSLQTVTSKKTRYLQDKSSALNNCDPKAATRDKVIKGNQLKAHVQRREKENINNLKSSSLMVI